jgi:23S rRNA (adenine2503-C2)-methyltransferase
MIPIPLDTSEPGRRSLLDLSLEELTGFMAELGQPAFRARQLWEWIYKRYAGDLTP